MKKIPILFQTGMVRDIQEGRKTQTRRIIKDFDKEAKYSKGDILWVREKFRPLMNCKTQELSGYDHYASMPDKFYEHEVTKAWKWKPSIFMPKEACRIFLEVTHVYTESITDISNEDAKAEGIEQTSPHAWKNYLKRKDPLVWSHPVDSFRSLWESINGEDSWQWSTFVVVIKFKKIQRPKDWPTLTINP